MRPKRHLAIFLKAPALGRGKRRLAREIGALAALSFQRRQVRRLLQGLALDRRWRSSLWVSPDSAALRPWGGLPALAQGRGDLGARMGRPFRLLPPGPVVLVGSDIPELTAAEIAEAFRRLGRSDAVFGPATDGGYWLVGLAPRQRRRLPFRKVAWSTPRALADTLANLGPARVALLPPLSDIDTGADYHAWRAREKGCP